MISTVIVMVVMMVLTSPTSLAPPPVTPFSLRTFLVIGMILSLLKYKDVSSPSAENVIL